RRRPGQREDAVGGIESRGGNSRGQRAYDRQQVAGIRTLDVDLRPEDRGIVGVVDVGVGIGNRYTRPAGYDVAPVVLAERRRIVAVEIDTRPVVVVVRRRQRNAADPVGRVVDEGEQLGGGTAVRSRVDCIVEADRGRVDTQREAGRQRGGVVVG